MTRRLWLLGALLLSAACKKTEAVQETLRDMQSGDTAPVRYTQTLGEDLLKAQAAQGQANAAIAKTQQGVADVLREADEK